jgi:uncharacterized protein YbaP (TraB family)
MTEDFYPLPWPMADAIEGAELVVVEQDTDPTRQKEERRDLASLAIYPDGVSAERDLSSDVQRALKAYCAGTGPSYDSIIRLKPWMIGATLTRIGLVRAGALPARSLDRHVQRGAEQAGKDLGILEPALAQARRLDDCSSADQSALLGKVLADLDNLGPFLQAVYTAWRSSDLATMEILVDQSFDAHPEARRILLTERNEAWAAELDTQSGFADRSLAVIGVAHLVGENSLLTELAQHGFTIRRVVDGADEP